MAHTNPFHLQQLRKLVQPTMEAVAELHQMLDIIHHREIHLDQIEEPSLRIRQASACQQLKKVAKIVAAVKGDPMNGVVQHDSRGHEKLPKPVHVDSLLAVLFEIDPALAQQLDRIASEDVFADVELAKVELPDAGTLGAAGREVPVLVGEGET
ncbi:hypothetical protein V8G54_005431 [Vigna mungo]|uniref:Uncharacterized protein n=1 Tax=Vigna mungo TaxID=3915 RepID=A0AAQ3S729_VIGMU